MQGSGFMGAVVAIVSAIVGLAALAVILSKNSTTKDLIGTSFGGLAANIGVAISPITGGGQQTQFGAMQNMLPDFGGTTAFH